jgi:hypothetical protein
MKILFFGDDYMDTPWDFVRGFEWLNKRNANVEGGANEILLGIYNPNTGDWIETVKVGWFAGQKPAQAKFVMGYDGVRMMRHFPKLIRLLDKTPSQDVTPERFALMLVACGFSDISRFPSFKDYDKTRQQLLALEKQTELIRERLATCRRIPDDQVK